MDETPIEHYYTEAPFFSQEDLNAIFSIVLIDSKLFHTFLSLAEDKGDV